MREEARQRDEEQKKLEAESKRADQELKEAQALLEEERKQIMDMFQISSFLQHFISQSF